MGKIILEHISYTFDQIKNGNWDGNDPYVKESLQFCQNWLQGQDSFDLQTSGSTGIPKTISVNSRQMEISAAATAKFFEIENHPNPKMNGKIIDFRIENKYKVFNIVHTSLSKYYLNFLS